MPINILIIIISVLIVLAGTVYRVVRKKNTLVISASFLLVLVFFMAMTFTINGVLTPSTGNSLSGSGLGERITPFIVGTAEPSAKQCEDAFNALQICDVFLFVATIISMIFESYHLFIKKNTNI